MASSSLQTSASVALKYSEELVAITTISNDEEIIAIDFQIFSLFIAASLRTQTSSQYKA